jgi:hypothetical protein
MSSIAESLLSGALGEGIDILDEREEDRKSAFLSNLEQGEQAGAQYLNDLITTAAGEAESKLNAFNQTFNSIQSNYKDIKRNTAPEFHTNLQLLLQQDADAFGGDLDVANARINNYFKSPSFINFGEDPEALARVKEAGAVVGPDAGINLLREAETNNRKKVYDFVGNVHTAATRDLLIGVDAVDLKSKDTPERFKGMETDQTAVKQDVAKLVDDFQLTNPLNLNAAQIASATNWTPTLTYADMRSALVMNNPGLGQDPIELQRQTFLQVKKNIDATEMKYGKGAVERLKAEGLIVSPDTIASFKTLEDAAVAEGINRQLDLISKDPGHPDYPTVALFNARQMTLNRSNPKDVEIMDAQEAVVSRLERDQRALITSTGYFDDKAMFVSSVVGQEYDTRMHVKNEDNGKIYSINPNITPEGNFKLYNINDPSDVEIFELGDIFPVDGKPVAQLGVLGQEKIDDIQEMVYFNYDGGKDQFYIDLFNRGIKIDTPIDVQIEQAEAEAQKPAQERFSRPLTDAELRTFARTGNLPEGVTDVTGPKDVAEIFDMQADTFEKDGKPFKLTRKQMRDYRSTGKLPEGVTKVK